jgi:hypothetical protein
MFIWTVRLLYLKISPKYELPTSVPHLVPEPNDSQSRGEKRGHRSIEDVTCFKVRKQSLIVVW